MRKVAVGPTLFVVISHAAAILGAVAYGILHGFTWTAAGIALLFYLLTSFSVSAGYHRLFTHGAYEAHWLFRGFLAFFGAGSFEGSAINWVTMHRQHHLGVDTDDDPHDIKKGFWWAHVGWVVFGYGTSRIKPNIDDLKRDPILVFQERFYAPIAILSGILLPWGLGYFLSDPWGGLCIGSFLRMVVFHHITWFINSAAHTFGSKPYDKNISATNSLFLALFTMGEGYHNFHHVFPYDYRNGPRYYDYDMTKWVVYLLSFVGLSKNLVRTDWEVIQRTSEKNNSIRPVPALEKA